MRSTYAMFAGITVVSDEATRHADLYLIGSDLTRGRCEQRSEAVSSGEPGRAWKAGFGTVVPAAEQPRWPRCSRAGRSRPVVKRADSTVGARSPSPTGRARRARRARDEAAVRFSSQARCRGEPRDAPLIAERESAAQMAADFVFPTDGGRYLEGRATVMLAPVLMNESPNHERLRRLLDVRRALAAETDYERLLERVLEEGRALTGARYAALGVVDEERAGLERFLTSGVDAATREAIGEPPRGRGVLGTLILDSRPLRVADVAQQPDSYGFPAGHPPMRSFLGVPIMIGGEVWGNLYFAEKEGAREFNEADERAAVVLAEWVAEAIENVNE